MSDPRIRAGDSPIRVLAADWYDGPVLGILEYEQWIGQHPFN